MNDTLKQSTSAIGEAMSLFFGDLTLGMLLAGFGMALVGILLSLLLGTTKRDPLSERTPVKFSWKFMLTDNAIRIYKSVLLTAIVLFLSLRFAEKFIGQKFSMFYSLLLGLCIDMVIDRWRIIKENVGKLLKSKPTPDV